MSSMAMTLSTALFGQNQPRAMRPERREFWGGGLRAIVESSRQHVNRWIESEARQVCKLENIRALTL